MDAPTSSTDLQTDGQTTPMMAQYLEIKRQHTDALLLYRMGDFYELFFDDAVKASATLGIALTKRGMHKGADIAMCGVPVHALDHYLHKLIRHGHRVALAEQMEDPSEAKKRGYKSVVARQVVRLITPGTLIEDTLLESRASNYLVCLTGNKATGELALAYADISTGTLAVMATDAGKLAAALARLSPSCPCSRCPCSRSPSVSSTRRSQRRHKARRCVPQMRSRKDRKSTRLNSSHG